MIYIRRDRNDTNGDPIRPSSEWFDSAERATRIAITEKQNHKADATIYAHNEVRSALERLFYEKCAYCEIKITGGFDWNVEHFRPKGSVAECRDHPGYYWLSYKWENLYPSCTHCNQRRRDKPTWGDQRYASTGGKADQFPLEDETTRAMSHSDDVEIELNLLIDPCNGHPEQYLTYDIYGQILAVEDSLCGQTTIDVCNLKRRRLSDSRRAIIRATIDMIKLIHKCESQGNNPGAESLKKWMREYLLDDSCQHAGAARTVKNDPGAFGI